MTSKEIRQQFFDFFTEKGHVLVPSASLLPENDPTLLFTNAGMNQFKDVFLGKGSRPYTRAVDTQRCMRVSGKHNDFDDVGRDTYHHTLFEMLGNWSFGDYYKEEAITWAWELLTAVWKFPKDKLYATVYKTDDEAREIWKTKTDIDPEHVLDFGDKDNFWEMGATGPCGPSSEIHYDRGPELDDDPKAFVNTGSPRYIELWNLVFIQYFRDENGDLTPLPAKNVDTGMGFERIVSVLQGKNSNYDTDLFTPILQTIEKISGKKYEKENTVPMQVIADHIRALTFALADGIMPSNEGRGYVLRKILRRAVRYGKKLGLDTSFLHRLVDTVVNEMKDVFPEVAEKVDMVKGLIFSEEESFFRTLNKGMDKLQEIVARVKKNKKHQISGEDVFLLYDSMGFPFDFTEQVAKDENLSVDMEGFQRLMEAQKERARASWKGTNFDLSILKGVVKATKYDGEDLYQSEGKIQLIVKDNSFVETASENDEVLIITDRTPFYGEKGGQVGDRGVMEKDSARIVIQDTQVYDDTILHYGRILNGHFSTGDRVVMKVDIDRKKATARNHTATHLIHRALHEFVGRHAEQAGSLVSPERLRFDFTHSEALTPEEIEKIENLVNSKVLENLPVKITRMNREEAKKSGAMAIFEEKYGEVVRVIEVEGFSRELCGGTHVRRTGDIGLVKIVSESSVSAGTRRLEAVTGLNSLENFRKLFNERKILAAELKTEEEHLPERVAQLQDKLKNHEREINTLKSKLAAYSVLELIDKAEEKNSAKIVITRTNMETKSLVSAVDSFKSRVKSGVIFLITSRGDKVSLVAGVSKTLTDKIKAGDIARECAKIVGGGGGGRPDMAQAGGKDTSRIDDALAKAREMIETALG